MHRSSTYIDSCYLHASHVHQMCITSGKWRATHSPAFRNNNHLECCVNGWIYLFLRERRIFIGKAEAYFIFNIQSTENGNSICVFDCERTLAYVLPSVQTINEDGTVTLSSFGEMQEAWALLRHKQCVFGSNVTAFCRCGVEPTDTLRSITVRTI